MSSTSSVSRRSNPKPKAKGKPVQGKNKRVDKTPNTELVAILEKFSVLEQVDIRRNCELLPKVIMSTWRECYKHLDMYEFQQQLIGDALHQFLYKMRRHFTSARFKGEQLQEQLNILDSSGIAELPDVRECEITWDNNMKDNSTQWPLHALPKLLGRLNHMQMYMPVKVGFIEHFGQLKSLSLHEEVSREALTAIWNGCKCLKRLKFFGGGTLNTIGISQCLELRELTLPVAAFNASSAFEVLQMPQLQLLELLPKDESTEATTDAISLVLRQRALDIYSFQLNSCQLDGANWLPKLELHRCIHLKSLVLIDCQFNELDMMSLGSLHVLDQATFCHCSDLKDSQVLNFAKACPQLTQLHLFDCKQLTTKLLYNLCEWRCCDKQGAPPLQLNLGDCQPLKEEFKQHFLLQSSLELLETPQEEHPQLQHVQFLFLRPISK
ncbi:uncharacterized protein LOC117790644 [Drosophila innubila]|uniref:uncharacterized protein LOC117790644 n=1 Tax=Drosophila innubila TaxID=198719 RepID=UPI00148B8C1B|nr:uncharacterized protein LOC117790644 [Drosophila innubila]